MISSLAFEGDGFGVAATSAAPFAGETGGLDLGLVAAGWAAEDFAPGG
ncbi:hypothetical protein ACPOL_2441 [Acidisarcina polymorpha]|uniref:Uncharacterized protein n=1 Tax=Acidisarcina polymorpha TaxID=2211140 RepID=A0A2Z5FXY9_9BACT|nr:hypothetical protein ACPOL_2441 [Acidisarcina polymorpha]